MLSAYKSSKLYLIGNAPNYRGTVLRWFFTRTPINLIILGICNCHVCCCACLAVARVRKPGRKSHRASRMIRLTSQLRNFSPRGVSKAIDARSCQIRGKTYACIVSTVMNYRSLEIFHSVYMCICRENYLYISFLFIFVCILHCFLSYKCLIGQRMSINH